MRRTLFHLPFPDVLYTAVFSLATMVLADICTAETRVTTRRAVSDEDECAVETFCDDDECDLACIAPNMIGDFFFGFPSGVQGAADIDRLFVVATDLDAPLILPPGNSTLTITEPGPVGVFSSSVSSIQQLQQLLRAGAVIPPAALEGVVADDATMTTALTVSQIQSLFASTPGVSFDIVPVAAPPASYDAAVDALFQTRNTLAGTTTFNSGDSGALQQSGGDTLNGGEDFDAFYFYSYRVVISVPSPSGAVGPAGRLKVADGNSPLPQDRVFFRYGYFDNVAMTADGVPLSRYVPGFEKTFREGLFSVEARFPFATSVDNEIIAGPGAVTNSDATSFGNIATYWKVLLTSGPHLSTSAGLGITIPTADDVHVRLVNGTELVRVENDAVHLQPFLAALYAPNDRWFVQGFFEVDIDAYGNEVAINTGSGLNEVGRIYDSVFAFTDVGIGYWLHRSNNATLTAVVPTIELHHSKSLQDADNVTAAGITVGNFGQNVEALNATAGSTFMLGDRASLAVGYVAPIGGDQQLDGGLRVLFDYYPAGRF